MGSVVVENFEEAVTSGRARAVYDLVVRIGSSTVALRNQEISTAGHGMFNFQIPSRLSSAHGTAEITVKVDNVAL